VQGTELRRIHSTAAGPLLREGPCTRAPGVGRIETLRQHARVCARLRRQIVGEMPLYEIVERHVFRFERARLSHRLLDLREEIFRRCKGAVAECPVLAAGVYCGGTGFTQQRERGVSVAVDEFRAELDADRERGLVLRPDPSADTVARFEQQGGSTGARELVRGRKTGGTRADDDHVAICGRHDWASIRDAIAATPSLPMAAGNGSRCVTSAASAQERNCGSDEVGADRKNCRHRRGACRAHTATSSA
jgi:hypothetical protein